MNGSSLTNRERRRNAAASRRAAREDAGNDDDGNGINIGGPSGSPAAPRQRHDDAEDPRRRMPEDRSRQQQVTSRKPLEGNLLSSLSQALTSIDKHNGDYFSGRGGGVDGNGHDRDLDGDSSPDAEVATNSNMHRSERKQRYYRGKLPPPPSRFSSYLKFNRPSLNCLLIFAACYLLVLICCLPMISYSGVDELPTDDEHHIQKGASFRRIRGRKQILKASHAVTDRLGTLKERAIKWEEGAKLKAKRGAVEWQEREREIINSIAGGTIGRRDGEDARRAGSLLEAAIGEFDAMRAEAEEDDRKKQKAAMAGGQDHWKDAVEAWDEEFLQDRHGNNVTEALGAVHKGKTLGFMVLGMHRSGTSMLSGLLVKGFGYETGGPLIGASFDNEKGFYERIDVVLQNDEFLGAQNAGWSWNVYDYDPDKALQHKEQGKITFKEGEKALKFLNNHMKQLPYLQKDPRMCIALPTWLKLLDDKPAVVFTYRHPLEVAMSLKHRENDFTIEHGLRLWIVYNMRALQNSAELCRVFSTNEAVFKDPLTEVQRIKNELTHKCHVINPPTHSLTSEVVDQFVDPKLQHNSKERKAEEEKLGVLRDFGNGCVAREFASDYDEKSANRKAEVEMFIMAMKVFCDLENGGAYARDYEWPDLVHWQRPAKIN